MSRRLLSTFALPVGAALAAAAVGNQLLCQAAEIPKGEEAGVKEEKMTNTKWWPVKKQKCPTRNDKQCNLAGLWKNDLGSEMYVSKVDDNGNFLDSTAVFVGQCFAEEGEEILQTSWLLREKVDSQSSNWKATRTGQNTFTRMC